MPLDRRQVLKYGFAGAIALALGGVGLSLRSTVLREPKHALRVLDAREFSVLAAAADRIAPARGKFPGAAELLVAEKIDAFLEGSHPSEQAEFKRLMWLLENALPGLLLDRRWNTFTASTPEMQDRILERWRTSRIGVRRTGWKALSGIVGVIYYAAPETYAAVGYPGPPDFGNVRRARP